MCRIFAGQPLETYACQTRSIRLGGHCTSIRLEAAFWHVLEEIAATQNISLAKFLTTLHDEVLELHGEVGNFSSLLRCACLTYLEQVKPAPESVAALRRDAARKVDAVSVAAE
jgi:predicted DNA-binding ribbon-helix-helix protein